MIGARWAPTIQAPAQTTDDDDDDDDEDDYDCEHDLSLAPSGRPPFRPPQNWKRDHSTLIVRQAIITIIGALRAPTIQALANLDYVSF